MSELLAKKLRHFRLDGESLELLRTAGDLLKPELDAVLEAFYARAQADPETAAFFSGPEQMASARAAQKAHWTRLLSAEFDADYIASVDRIGRVHARIHLPMDAFMSFYSLATSDLIAAFLENTRSTFRPNSLKRVRAQVGVLTRAFALDIERISSITVQVLAEEQSTAFRYINTAIERMAEGDLTMVIPGPEESDFPVAFDPVRRSLNTATATLGKTLGLISNNTDQLAVIVDTVKTATQDLSNRTASQAASLEQTAAAIHELTENVSHSSRNTDSAKQVADHAASSAGEGTDSVAQASEAMSRIQTSSDKITQIIGMIDDISFQTNLLALNAGVEAARAGAAGRGFAVVAEEVRVLAGNASDAARQIKELVNASSQEVASGVDLIDRAQQTLSSIAQTFEQVAGLSNEIAGASHEQSTALNQINSAISQMDIVTQKNAAMVDETTSAANQMHQLYRCNH